MYEVINSENVNVRDYVFFKQNRTNFRTCLKNTTKNEFIVRAAHSKYVLSFTNEKDALSCLYNDVNIGCLETDMYEEIDRIDSSNIQSKTEILLQRFNLKFKLNVSYTPTEEDIEGINLRVKKTKLDDEARYLLNFYMMEVLRERLNTQWKFKKVETFNPFYSLSVINTENMPVSFYRILGSPRKWFDFNDYIKIYEHRWGK